MMLFLALFIFPLAFAFDNCPETESVSCWTADSPQKFCWGGYDVDGCMKQDTCIDMYSEYAIGNDGNACYNTCDTNCNEEEVWCDSGMDWNGCWMGGYCLSSYNDCPAVCYNNCGENSTSCDMGYDDAGCWKGNYCAYGYDTGLTTALRTLDLEVFCPGVCSTQCAEGETSCNHPYDSNGCWMGNWCAPEGTECPVQCPEVEPAQCDYNEETMCWGGNDQNGCAYPDYCIPSKSTWNIGNDGEACWNTCSYPCNYEEGALYCDMGYNDNGCYMGNYCATSYGDCAAVCYVSCGSNETYCSNGYDENWCSMGNYCAPEGTDCVVDTITA